MTLGADVQVTAGDITFNGSVSGSAHDLSLSGTGTQSLKAVDVASLSTGSTGSTVLQGNVTTSSDQRYANAVTAAADVTLAAGSGTVSFGSTLNGTTADTESVTVTAAGTTFTGAVRGGTRLAALTVTNAARVDGGRVDAVTQSYGALEIGAAPYGKSKTSVADKLKEAIGSIGENMSLRRTAYLAANKGVVASYMHNQASLGLGKIGVIVALESTGEADKLKAFGKQVAMHIAAANPQAVDTANLDKELVERERAVLTEQAKESGKPADVIACR